MTERSPVLTFNPASNTQTCCAKAHFQIPRLQLKSGEIVAICGANGSGKSFLLRHLLGYEAGFEDLVTLYNEPMSQLLLDHTMRQRLGFYAHGLRIGGEMLRSSALITLHRRIYRTCSMELSDKFDLDSIKNIPLQYLSAGQRARLGLWLAMGHNPDFCLMDEPESHLDSHYLDVLVNEISRGTPNRSYAIVTHNKAIMDLAHQTWFCERRTPSNSDGSEDVPSFRIVAT